MLRVEQRCAAICSRTLVRSLRLAVSRSADGGRPGLQPLRRRTSTSTHDTRLPATAQVQDDLRAAMREVAQPVAVITAHLPVSQSDASAGSDQAQARLVHGATISSFTTISMNPPLVAFSLRTPSRIAHALESHPAAATAQPASSSSRPDAALTPRPHFLINLLTHKQADVAAAFARPGLSPLAFESAASRLRTAASDQDGNSASASASPAGAQLDLPAWPSAHTVGHVPALAGSIGALACRLEFKLDLGLLPQEGSASPAAQTTSVSADSDEMSAEESQAQAVVGEGTVRSELFVARVLAIERESAGHHQHPSEVSAGAGDDQDPLVYCRHKFWTIGKGSR